MERDSSSQKGLDLESRQKEKVKDKEWLKVLRVWVWVSECVYVWQRKKNRERRRKKQFRERETGPRSTRRKRIWNYNLPAVQLWSVNCCTAKTSTRTGAWRLSCIIAFSVSTHLLTNSYLARFFKSTVLLDGAFFPWDHGTEEGSVTWVGAVVKHTTDLWTNHLASLTSCSWMTVF